MRAVIESWCNDICKEVESLQEKSLAELLSKHRQQRTALQRLPVFALQSTCVWRPSPNHSIPLLYNEDTREPLPEFHVLCRQLVRYLSCMDIQVVAIELAAFIDYDHLNDPIKIRQPNKSFPNIMDTVDGYLFYRYPTFRIRKHYEPTLEDLQKAGFTESMLRNLMPAHKFSSTPRSLSLISTDSLAGSGEDEQPHLT